MEAAACGARLLQRAKDAGEARKDLTSALVCETMIRIQMITIHTVSLKE